MHHADSEVTKLPQDDLRAEVVKRYETTGMLAHYGIRTCHELKAAFKAGAKWAAYRGVTIQSECERHHIPCDAPSAEGDDYCGGTLVYKRGEPDVGVNDKLYCARCGVLYKVEFLTDEPTSQALSEQPSSDRIGLG